MSALYLLLAGMGLSAISTTCPAASQQIGSQQTTIPETEFQVVQTAAPLKAEEISDTPIKEQPEGDVKLYTRNSYGFSGYGTRVYFSDLQLQPVKIIYADDNIVYLYNPYSQKNTESYLKGTLDGDKITVRLPQPIYEEEMWDNPGTFKTFYATLLNVAKNEEGQITVSPADSDIVTYTINDDKISLDLGYEYGVDENGNSLMPEKILGMVDAEGNWKCYGDCYHLNTPYTFKATVAPEGLKTERWAMTWAEEGKFVNVGFDGNDVYLQGLEDKFPDAWIKGSRNGDIISFKSGQLLGEIPYYLYLTFCSAYSKDDDDQMLYLQDSADFTINETEHSMYPAPETVLISNAAGTDYVSWFKYYESPLIRLQPADIDKKPLRPVFNGHLDVYEDYGYNNFSFYLSYFNEQYYLLDIDNLYYEVRFDDEVVTFTKDEYYMSEDITKVPFNLTEGAITATGTFHNISYYMMAPETISLQLFNVVDGETYASAITTFDIATNQEISKVDEPTAMRKVTSTQWYSLDGLLVEKPTKGLYIRIMTFEDGTKKADKIAINVNK